MGDVQLDRSDASTLLAGRYRLAELLAETPGPDGASEVGVVRTWRAVDEVLSRPVVAHVVSREHPQAQALVTAARAAATVNDPRLIRVFDAHVNGVAYVIREWFEGDNLDVVLADGPINPERAGSIAREVAEALAVAHAAGLAHRRLDLQSVLVGHGDAVKVLGLAVDRAVEGLPTGSATSPRWLDPGARDDARGIGMILHACLTGRWAGAGPSNLPVAPTSASGHVLSPRQCRAGVPRALDLIAERGVDDEPRHGEALGTPAEVAAALADAGAGSGEPTAFSLPPVAGVLASRLPDTGQSHATNPAPAAEDYDTEYSLAAQADTSSGPSGARSAVGAEPGDAHPAPPRPPRPTDRRPGSSHGPQRRQRRLGVGLVAVLVLAGLVMLGWQLTATALDQRSPLGDATPSESAPTGPTPTDTPSSTPDVDRSLPIVDAGDFDPEGDGGEHPNLVRFAYDRDHGTSWTTMQYRGDPHLGRIKNGVGMWIDLGEVTSVSSVSVDLVGNGTNLQLRVPEQPNASDPPASIDGWRTVARQPDAGSTVDLRPETPVRSRFVLIWLTKIPPDGTGNYRGGISEIDARG